MSLKRPLAFERFKIGRHSEYNDEIATEICCRIAEGESIRSICKLEHMPAMSTIFLWLKKNEEFQKQYEIAREWQADSFADELISIADDGTNDWMEKLDKDGACIGYQVNGEHVQRSRLRVDARKWIASKYKPKKYGDRIGLENADETKPFSIIIKKLNE